MTQEEKIEIAVKSFLNGEKNLTELKKEFKLNSDIIVKKK